MKRNVRNIFAGIRDKETIAVSGFFSNAKPPLHQRQQHPQQHQRHQHEETSRCPRKTPTPPGSGTPRSHRHQSGHRGEQRFSYCCSSSDRISSWAVAGFISRVPPNPIETHSHSPVGAVFLSGLLGSSQPCMRLLRCAWLDSGSTYQTDFDILF